MYFFIRFNRLTVFVFVLFLITACKTNDEPVSKSSFITKVFDYKYGPGQHASLAKPADIQYFKGDPGLHSGWVYLGGFGGYISAGFDHDITNKEGFDFEVFALKGTGPEPAIVYVMQDENGDGLPNETWFELKENPCQKIGHAQIRVDEIDLHSCCLYRSNLDNEWVVGIVNDKVHARKSNYFV